MLLTGASKMLHGRKFLPSSPLQAAPVQRGYMNIGGVDHALFVGANVVGRANDESQRKATVERFQSQRNLHHVHGEFPAAATGMTLPSAAGFCACNASGLPASCPCHSSGEEPCLQPGPHCALGLAGLQHMPAQHGCLCSGINF